jgi:hypothetical protein
MAKGSEKVGYICEFGLICLWYGRCRNLNAKPTSCLNYLFYGKCRHCNVFVDFFWVLCSMVEANAQNAFIFSTIFLFCCDVSFY